MTAREDRGDEVPDLMEALKQSVERAREKRRDREDRGVQVEARMLSGVHIGQQVTAHDAVMVLTDVWQSSVRTTLWQNGRRFFHLAPTDLVTLTDGGASE